MYSMSNGGSVRSSTASNSVSARATGGSARYQSSASPVRVMRAMAATTRPPSIAMSRWRNAYSSWPRRAASTIMA